MAMQLYGVGSRIHGKFGALLLSTAPSGEQHVLLRTSSGCLTYPRFAIVITFFIYIRAGRTIYEKRRELREVSTSDGDVLDPGFGTLKTTEVSVTTEFAHAPPTPIHLQSLRRHQSAVPSSGEQYSVTISADPGPSIKEAVSSSDCSTPTTPAVVKISTRFPNALNRSHVHERNNAAWSYTKCAILFFTAILITWIPSSANRVFSVVHRGKHSFPLEFMSAFVLPLQGFWNAAIYFVTSWSACKSLFADLRQGRRPDIKDLLIGSSRSKRSGDGQDGHRGPYRMHLNHPNLNNYASESLRKLADRGTSDDERLSC